MWVLHIPILGRKTKYWLERSIFITDYFDLKHNLVHDAFCGGLNNNGSHKLLSFNTWSSAGKIDREGLGGTVLLEGVCHRGVGFKELKKSTFSVPCLPFKMWNSSCFCCHAWTLNFWNISPIKCSLFWVALVMVLYHNNRKKLRYIWTKSITCITLLETWEMNPWNLFIQKFSNIVCSMLSENYKICGWTF